MAYANDPSIRNLGGRKYIYDLITKVMNDSSYDQPTKFYLIKTAKWFLIKELFEKLKRNPSIEKLMETNSLNYKPTQELSNQNELQEIINELYKKIKNGIPNFEYNSWLEELKVLDKKNLIDKMDDYLKEEYIGLIKRHEEEVKILIEDNKLSEKFLLCGIL